LNSVPADANKGYHEFEADLIRQIGGQIQISDEDAGRILYALYQERAIVGSGEATWHQRLSELTGVPVKELVPTVAEPIDEHLRSAIVPGKIVSARTVLTQDSQRTLANVMDSILVQHAQEYQAHLAQFGF